MRKQILLIDDDLPLCRQLRDALQDDTTEVRYFIDTAEALDSFMNIALADGVLEEEKDIINQSADVLNIPERTAIPIRCNHPLYH